MLWSDFTTALGALLQYEITAPASAVPSSNADFNNILPRCVEYTELKMQRDPELDFLANRVTNASQETTLNSNQVTAPAGMLVIEAVNIISPAGTSPSATTAVRNPVAAASIDFINALYPSPNVSGVVGIAKYWAPLTESSVATTIVIGPGADAVYFVEFRGTQRQPALSASNTSNVLSVLLPDLYLAAAMEFMSGFERDFGSQADDPKMALSWAAEYDKLKAGAAVEEARKKLWGDAWSAYPPTPAKPPRN